MIRIFQEVFRILVIVSALVKSTAKDVGFLEQPQFSFIEKDDLVVKYPDSVKQNVERHLYVCCNNSMLHARLSCMFHSKCPAYEEVETCNLIKGNIVQCYISYVLTNTTWQGKLLESDSQNVTVTSKVATYVTNDSTKTPRPVINLHISTEGSGVLLKWTPSTIYFTSQVDKYSQSVFCQPVDNENAKALRKNIDFGKSSYRVLSANITALTKYKCCVQVDNEISPKPSEPTCAMIQSPEQAPSSAPLITCGNATRPCSYYVINGSQRNITITYKLPKPSDRNGEIVHSIVSYHNITASNSTAPHVVVVNGSYTSVSLLLGTHVDYLVSVKSCTKNGCSPSSNTVRIHAIHIEENHQFPLATIIGIVVTCVLLITLLVAMTIHLRRRVKNAIRGKLPVLDPTSYLEYSYPTAPDSDTTYDTLQEESPPVNFPPVEKKEPPLVGSADNLACVSIDDET